jgi:hypothetical protein
MRLRPVRPTVVLKGNVTPHSGDRSIHHVRGAVRDGCRKVHAVNHDRGQCMATYRIVCTDQESSGHSNQEAHIVAVGVGDDPNKAQRKWTLDEVLRAIDRGDLFYTKGVNTGKVALVEKYTCALCRRVHIRSAADKVTDNNLNRIPRCSGSSQLTQGPVAHDGSIATEQPALVRMG